MTTHDDINSAKRRKWEETAVKATPISRRLGIVYLERCRLRKKGQAVVVDRSEPSQERRQARRILGRHMWRYGRSSWASNDSAVMPVVIEEFRREFLHSLNMVFLRNGQANVAPAAYFCDGQKMEASVDPLSFVFVTGGASKNDPQGADGASTIEFVMPETDDNSERTDLTSQPKEKKEQ